MFRNIIFLTVWFLSSFGLTFFAFYITKILTKIEATSEAMWYMAAFTSIVPIFIFMFFGWAWIWIILVNMAMFFMLPMWWMIDASQKLKTFLILLVLNTAFNLLVFFIFWAVGLGF